MSIEIALKPATGKSLPGNIQAIIQNEYASRYLEGIGANPSKENVDLMLKSLPLKEALLLPVWQREAIVIIPGVAKNADITSIMSTMVNSADINEKRNGSPEHTRKKHIPVHTKQKPSDKTGNRNVSFNPTLSSPKKETPLKKSRRLSWCTVNTLDILDPIMDHIGVQEARTKHFRNLLLPLGSLDDNILNAVRSFNHSLDGFLLQTDVINVGALYRTIKIMLMSTPCCKLFDAMCRFCYWNIIHPSARKVLVAAKQMDPCSFPDNIPTTAAAKLESIAYMFNEKNAKKRKEEEESKKAKEKEAGDDNEEGANDSGAGTPAVVDDELKEDEGAGGVVAGAGAGEETEVPQVTDGQQGLEQSVSEVDLNGDAAGLDPGAVNQSFISSTATDTSLDIKEREIIFLQLEQCVHNIHRELDRCEISVSTAMQALVACSHYVVDEILTELYPWFKIQGKKKTAFEKMHLTSNHTAVMMKDKDSQPRSRYNHPHFNDFDSKPEDSIHKLRLQIRRLMHQALSDVIDPSRLFTSTLLKKSCVRTPLNKDPVQTNRSNIKSTGAKPTGTTRRVTAEDRQFGYRELEDIPLTALQQTKPATHSRYFTTSIGIRAVYEHDARSPSTRKLLNLSTTTPYATIPGLTNPRYEGGDLGLEGTVGHVSVLTDDLDEIGAEPSRVSTAATAGERKSSQSYQCAYRVREINSNITTAPHALGFGGEKPKTASAAASLRGGKRRDLMNRQFSASSVEQFCFSPTGAVRQLHTSAAQMRSSSGGAAAAQRSTPLSPVYPYMGSPVADPNKAVGFSTLFHHSSAVQVTEPSGTLAENTEEPAKKPEFAVGTIDSVVELALPCPYYETKEHNRFTRNIDAADIALRQYQEEQARLAAASSVRRPKLTKKQSARMLDTGSDSPGSFTPGGAEHGGGLMSVRSPGLSLEGSVETTPRGPNQASELLTSPIKTTVNSNYPHMKGSSEKTLLSNTFYFEKPPPEAPKEDPVSLVNEARRTYKMQKIVAKQAQERRGDPAQAPWRLSCVKPSVDATRSDFEQISKVLPEVTNPNPKLADLEVIPISSEGRNKLLKLAIERTGMQYGKRHM